VLAATLPVRLVPAGSEEPNLRFLDAELESWRFEGVVVATLDLARLRGVDSSSGKAKLSLVTSRLDSSC
jgi:hypothetical protein